MSYTNDPIDLGGYGQPGKHTDTPSGKKTVGPSPDAGGYTVGPNTEGTGSRGVPTAIALKGKKKKLPAVANPDGKESRP